MKQLVYILLALVLFQACSQQSKSMKEEVMPAKASSKSEIVVDTVVSDEEAMGYSKNSSNTDKADFKIKEQEKINESVVNKVPNEEVLIEEIEISANDAKEINSPNKEVDVKETTTEKENLSNNNSLKEVLSGKISGVKVSKKRAKKQQVESYKTKKITVSPEIHEVFVESAQQKLQQLFDIAILLDDENTTQEMKDYALSNSFRYYLKPKEKMNAYLLKLNKIKADSIVLSSMKLKRLVPLETVNSYKGIYKVQVNYYQTQKLLKQSNKTATLLLEIVPLNVDGQIYTTIESKVLDIK